MFQCARWFVILVVWGHGSRPASVTCPVLVKPLVCCTRVVLLRLSGSVFQRVCQEWKAVLLSRLANQWTLTFGTSWSLTRARQQLKRPANSSRKTSASPAHCTQDYTRNGTDEHTGEVSTTCAWRSRPQNIVSYPGRARLQYNDNTSGTTIM